ncbi:16S rRNA (cytosine(1402)-N(4))-methyltransferase RsmH [Patescibacteria group bacterium]|nr:16S rRNA (cytosine(1402)-N(4))-methyltransferase RsmH [Patescibacteria group bacterium]
MMTLRQPSNDKEQPRGRDARFNDCSSDSQIKLAHTPVLLKEVLEYLDPKKGDIVLDATYGGGGHASAVCEKIGSVGILVGMDQDSELLKAADRQDTKCKTILINENFRNLGAVLKNLKIEKIDKALFDLGMNSGQIEESGRGFSFQKDEPLFMSYKLNLGSSDLTAKEILNTWGRNEIYEILREYGEERFARSISENIIKRRKMKKLETTFDLVSIIEESVPGFYKRGRIHPATKTFQALRIAVNDELNALSEGLSGAWNFLKSDGRLVVISFHSLEDRIVKNFIRDKKLDGKGVVLTKKPVVAGDEETNLNPRSRSAKLRAIIKF